MALTLVEKILSQRLSRPVHAGEVVVCPVDRVLLHDDDNSRVEARLAELGAIPRERVPAPVEEEALARAGEFIAGGCRHPGSAGALAALSVGFGATDLACAMAYGEVWLRVPASFRIDFTGVLEPGVGAEDAMFALVGRLGPTGAAYCALELGGDGLAGLAIELRMALCRLAAASGAKLGIAGADERLEHWLQQRGRGEDFAALSADEGARYARHLKLSLGRQEPMLVLPDRPGHVVPVEELEGEPVAECVLGGGTASWLPDLRIVARLLRGRTVAGACRLRLLPSSDADLDAARREGLLEPLVAAGAELLPPAVDLPPQEGTTRFASSGWSESLRPIPAGARVLVGSAWTLAAAALHAGLRDPREVADHAR